MTNRRVVPFIHTGCFCNVSRNGTQTVLYDFADGWYRLSAQVILVTLHGDESSPLHCVVPFNRTGYIRGVPGTAHRPFPTVSLEGGLVHPHGLCLRRCMVVLRFGHGLAGCRSAHPGGANPPWPVGLPCRRAASLTRRRILASRKSAHPAFPSPMRWQRARRAAQIPHRSGAALDPGQDLLNDGIVHCLIVGQEAAFLFPSSYT